MNKVQLLAVFTIAVAMVDAKMSPRLYFSFPLRPINPVKPVNPVNPQPGNLDQQRQAAMANGNAYRSQHAASPLLMDPTLAAEAQQYAEELARTGVFQHSNPGSPARYGENLAALPTASGSATIAAANTAWYGERPAYCPSGAAGINGSNGHFTQMVWKESTLVGYGSAVSSNGYTYVVARYSPPGNNPATVTANVSC